MASSRQTKLTTMLDPLWHFQMTSCVVIETAQLSLKGDLLRLMLRTPLKRTGSHRAMAKWWEFTTLLSPVAFKRVEAKNSPSIFPINSHHRVIKHGQLWLLLIFFCFVLFLIHVGFKFESFLVQEKLFQNLDGTKMWSLRAEKELVGGATKRNSTAYIQTAASPGSNPGSYKAFWHILYGRQAILVGLNMHRLTSLPV